MPAAPTTSELLMFVSGYLQKLLQRDARAQKIRWNALMVLNDLHLLGPTSQRTLAEIEQIQAPTLTVLVKQMEARGWIRRTQSDADARVSLVSLTAKGLAQLRASNDRLRKRVEQELECIPAARREDLRRSLLPLARELMRSLPTNNMNSGDPE
jgi:DNA-binding MarR family transcriptional regulator